MQDDAAKALHHEFVQQIKAAEQTMTARNTNPTGVTRKLAENGLPYR